MGKNLSTRDCVLEGSKNMHKGILLPNFAKRCWVNQANTETLCNVTLTIDKHDTLTPGYKRLGKVYHSTNYVEYECLA